MPKDERTLAEKLQDAIAMGHEPGEIANARRLLASLLEREGASLSLATVEREAVGLRATERARLIAEYERWAQAGRPRHTREWRA